MPGNKGSLIVANIIKKGKIVQYRFCILHLITHHVCWIDLEKSEGLRLWDVQVSNDP